MLLIALLQLQTDSGPLRRVSDPGVVTTHQTITPAGAQTVFAGRVHGVAFGTSAQDIWALVSGRQSAAVHLSWAENRVLARVPIEGGAGMQGLTLDATRHTPYLALGVAVPIHGSQANASSAGGTAVAAKQAATHEVVRLAAVEGDSLRTVADELGAGFTTGALSVARDIDTGGHRLAIVTLTDDDSVAVIDVGTGAVVRKVATGIAPFGAAIDSSGMTAYVTNWGGRRPKPGERAAPTGDEKTADRVVVDARGVAVSGTVTRIDLRTGATRTVAVGLHPTALAWDQPRHRLYVADGNSDAVSVIATTTDAVVRTISVNPFAGRPFGAAPTALAVSPDGATLYVACGGLNSIVVIDATSGAARGLIPTAWYPASLAVSADGRYLAVGAMLGVGSGTAGRLLDEYKADFFPHGPRPDARYVHSYRGTVSVVEVPDAAQLSAYTAAVAANDRLALVPALRVRSSAPDASAAPTHSWPPIDHVVYIVKENRSYDQVLGDIGKGDSDSSLAMYGRDVAPNHHRLAEQFVLLDNFYATGGNSGDGHQWVTQANETDYTMWPGYGSRSYPKNGNDPLAYSKSGFIWNAAQARGRSVEIFGEYVGGVGDYHPGMRLEELDKFRRGETYVGRFHTVAPIAPLNRILAPDYPAYGGQIPDVARARIFARHVAHWDSTGTMPNLVIVQLPSDHTAGTAPGWTSPKAMVADNDLALGQIVDALSHSRFWPHLAIFVVEDDAQGGVDHVDGHRTVALAVSPYIKRGSVDHTFYSHPSLLKTIEGMLGLDPLTLFDRVANDLRTSFVDSADLTPYTAAEPAQSIYEANARVSELTGAARRAALASARMNWREPDAAPAETLNRILWHDARGWDTQYPGAKHAVFAPLAVDQDDDP